MEDLKEALLQIRRVSSDNLDHIYNIDGTGKFFIAFIQYILILLTSLSQNRVAVSHLIGPSLSQRSRVHVKQGKFIIIFIST